MGLSASLMVAVGGIMAWVLQSENGGILNILFRYSGQMPDGTPVFETVSNVVGSTVDYFVKMILLKPAPLGVLEHLPENVGGGKRGVKFALDHPNREATIFWLTISMFLLVVILLIVIQVINARCCCVRSYGSNSLNTLQGLIERSSFQHKELIIRIVYIFTLIMAAVFLVVSVVLLIIYFTATGLVVSYLSSSTEKVSNDTPTSLPDGLHSTLIHLESFVDKGTTSGQMLTDHYLNYFVNETNDEISFGARRTIDNILDYLMIQNCLTFGGETIRDFEIINDNLLTINREAVQLKFGLSSLENEINATQLKFSETLKGNPDCESNDKCKDLKAQIQSMKSPVQSKDINTSITETFMTELMDVITKMTSQIYKVNSTIVTLRNSTNDILSKIETQLDLQAILNNIDQFWDDLRQKFDEILSKMNGTINDVQIQLPKYVIYVKICFYTIGGVFFVMMLVASLIAVNLFYRAFNGRLFGNPTLRDTSTGKWAKKVCGKGSVCCCSVLFIPVLLIFSAIIATLLFALTMASGEGCVYLAKESAVAKTDVVINSLIVQNWNSTIGDSLGKTDGFLSIQLPKNLLRALEFTCSSTSDIGLLAAVNYTNLVNTTKFAESPGVQNGIKEGKKAVVQLVKDLKIGENMPMNTTLENFVTQISMALNQFNLTNIVNITDPSNYKNESLIRIALQADGLVSLVPKLEDDINSLRSCIETLKMLREQAGILHEMLKRLDERKSKMLKQISDFTLVVKVTIAAAEETKLLLEVGNQYDKLADNLTTFIIAVGDRQFANLTYSLLPCREAYFAVNAAVATTCGDSGGVHLLLGLSYVLALNVLFLSFLYFSLFNLAFLQTLQIRMLSGIVAQSDPDIYESTLAAEDKSLRSITSD